MATKSELVEKVQSLTRKLAEREQDRLDKIYLSKQLAESLAEVDALKSVKATRHKENSAPENAALQAEIDKLRRENAAK